MWTAIFIIGFLAAIVFVVMGIIGAIKKNGTAKKRFLWALISFISFIVGAANIPSTETHPTASSAESSSDKKTEDKAQKEADAKAKKEADDKAKAEEKAKKDAEAKAKAEADAKAKTEAEAKAKAEAEAKAPRTGDTVSVGNFSIAVSDPRTSTSIGNEFLNQKAKGIYWIFAVAVRNDDKEARTVDTSMFELVSSTGVKYEPDSTAGIYANDNSGFFLEKINPGIVLKGFVVFDMPKDQQIVDYKMQVRGGVGFKSTKPVDILLKPKE